MCVVILNVVKDPVFFIKILRLRLRMTKGETGESLALRPVPFRVSR